MVLLNLVENASKYGKQNGSITASVYNTDGKHVLVEITDDGIGIEEEHLQRIFERFYRTDSARSRDKGGTGLGLAICKHIIEAHGQAIHVRSTPDVGTALALRWNRERISRRCNIKLSFPYMDQYNPAHLFRPCLHIFSRKYYLRQFLP